jgi:hypothetical protein
MDFEYRPVSSGDMSEGEATTGATPGVIQPTGATPGVIQDGDERIYFPLDSEVPVLQMGADTDQLKTGTPSLTRPPIIMHTMSSPETDTATQTVQTTQSGAVTTGGNWKILLLVVLVLIALHFFKGRKKR